MKKIKTKSQGCGARLAPFGDGALAAGCAFKCGPPPRRERRLDFPKRFDVWKRDQMLQETLSFKLGFHWDRQSWSFVVGFRCVSLGEVKMITWSGFTPLHLACQMGHWQLLPCLVCSSGVFWETNLRLLVQVETGYCMILISDTETTWNNFRLPSDYHQLEDQILETSDDHRWPSLIMWQQLLHFEVEAMQKQRASEWNSGHHGLKLGWLKWFILRLSNSLFHAYAAFFWYCISSCFVVDPLALLSSIFPRPFRDSSGMRELQHGVLPLSAPSDLLVASSPQLEMWETGFILSISYVF